MNPKQSIKLFVDVNLKVVSLSSNKTVTIHAQSHYLRSQQDLLRRAFSHRTLSSPIGDRIETLPLA